MATTTKTTPCSPTASPRPTTTPSLPPCCAHSPVASASRSGLGKHVSPSATEKSSSAIPTRVVSNFVILISTLPIFPSKTNLQQHPLLLLALPNHQQHQLDQKQPRSPLLPILIWIPPLVPSNNDPRPVGKPNGLSILLLPTLTFPTPSFWQMIEISISFFFFLFAKHHLQR